MSMSQGMVDISGKEVSSRRAVAMAEIKLGKKVFDLWQKQGSPKGDVLAAAKVAGVLAAKQTPALIPYCHPLPLNKVNIDFKTDRKGFIITIIGEVTSLGRTGVEMEALTAVTVAALTVYDMLKGYDKAIVIRQVCLLAKSGGKSGNYQRGK